MTRNSRQLKILELINSKEIERQEELVDLLRCENFNVTQATVSRDIKELGLIKILTDNKKYKYAYIENGESSVSNKYLNIFKEAVVGFKQIDNIVLIKTIKGLASGINSFIDRFSIENLLGSVCGDDVVTLYFETSLIASSSLDFLNSLLFDK